MSNPYKHGSTTTGSILGCTGMTRSQNQGTPGSSRANISWLKSLCQRLGLVTNLDISIRCLISGFTYLGIALDTCWSHKAIRQEGDMAIYSVCVCVCVGGGGLQHSSYNMQCSGSMNLDTHLIFLEKLVPFGRNCILDRFNQ